MQRSILNIALFALLPMSLCASPEVFVDQVGCIPVAGHGVIRVRVENEPAAASTRIFIRRMNKDVSDFYYLPAYTNGGGNYWGTLPKPGKYKLITPGLSRLRAEWWSKQKSSKERDWLHALDPQTRRKRLEDFHYEPVEYYAALFDADGNLLARSDLKVASVKEDCNVKLTLQQKGETENLIVGETAAWQGKATAKPFHWECSGIVTRIDPQGVRRVDVCRNPFIALWDEEPHPATEISHRVGIDAKAKQPWSIEVFYGTDRKWTQHGSSVWKSDLRSEFTGYGIERGTLEFGTLTVTIPVTHAVGELEERGIFEFRMDPTRHVVLRKVSRKPRELFVSELRHRIACRPGIVGSEESNCKPGKKAALVFIHGYNVSFEDAARRTAQIAYDLKFDGVPLMYSWPSQASIPGYTIDEANIRWTVPHLEEFLTLLVKDTQADSVHVIAHSMGNRAVTEVLRRFATENRAFRHPVFNQIVLVAPDVDSAVFRDEIAPAFAGVGKRVTLYASANDKALNVSKGLHQYPRAGDLSEDVVIVKGVETIDASDVDTSLLRPISLGHSYFARKENAIADLKLTLEGVEAKDKRRCLKRFYSENGDTYWKIRGGKRSCRR